MHWSVSNSLISSYLQPCTNSNWEMKGNQWLSLLWIPKRGRFFSPDLLIALRRYGTSVIRRLNKLSYHNHHNHKKGETVGLNKIYEDILLHGKFWNYDHEQTRIRPNDCLHCMDKLVLGRMYMVWCLLTFKCIQPLEWLPRSL